jgi:hypothetical protein
MLFSLPDILVRIAINATIPAKDNTLTCYALSKNGDLLEWGGLYHKPTNLTEYCAQHIPSAYNSIIKKVLGGYYKNLDPNPNSLVVNMHNKTSNSFALGISALGIGLILIVGAAYALSKIEDKMLGKSLFMLAIMDASCAFLNGGEIFLHGYVTDYLSIFGSFCNLADLYALMGPAICLSTFVVRKHIAGSYR